MALIYMYCIIAVYVLDDTGLAGVCQQCKTTFILNKTVECEMCNTVVSRLSQGGKPSPFDRNLSTKLAAKAVEKLIQQIEESKTATGITLLPSVLSI